MATPTDPITTALRQFRGESYRLAMCVEKGIAADNIDECRALLDAVSASGLRLLYLVDPATTVAATAEFQALRAAADALRAAKVAESEANPPA